MFVQIILSALLLSHFNRLNVAFNDFLGNEIGFCRCISNLFYSNGGGINYLILRSSEIRFLKKI